MAHHSPTAGNTMKNDFRLNLNLQVKVALVAVTSLIIVACGAVLAGFMVRYAQKERADRRAKIPN